MASRTGQFVLDFSALFRKQRFAAPMRSDTQSVEVADLAQGGSGYFEGTLAWMSVVSFLFVPPLSGCEVPVDGPDQ